MLGKLSFLQLKIVQKQKNTLLKSVQFTLIQVVVVDLSLMSLEATGAVNRGQTQATTHDERMTTWASVKFRVRVTNSLDSIRCQGGTLADVKIHKPFSWFINSLPITEC